MVFALSLAIAYVIKMIGHHSWLQAGMQGAANSEEKEPWHP
jgi:hypothetical protein